MSTTSRWFETLARMRGDELRAAFERSAGPDLERMVGYAFRGFNTGAVPARLGIQKFIKGFFREDGTVEGYNLRVHQTGLDGPWLARPGDEPRGRFGFFTVAPVQSGTLDAARCPAGAVLLDYGASARNPRWRPERLLRDYLVVPDPAHRDVLLGRAYLAFPGRPVHAAFFVLERERPIEGAGAE
jgi:hypothetical protein